MTICTSSPIRDRKHQQRHRSAPARHNDGSVAAPAIRIHPLTARTECPDWRYLAMSSSRTDQRSAYHRTPAGERGSLGLP